VSLLPTTYKILSNILVSRLTPYIEKIIEVHHCGFQCNTLTADHIFCSCQIMEKKSESVMGQYIIYLNILERPMTQPGEYYCTMVSLNLVLKLVRLIKMCLNGAYSKVHIGKNLSVAFPMQNSQRQRDALFPLYSNFALEYGIRKAQEKLESSRIEWNTSAPGLCCQC
jgi:hypothetical protein